ncbi:MAG: polysaccharide biosynthesis protein, partial [Clostridia bacterium]|nr:polysaccharide biosynthesis protein [Clostridia bacterium]
MSGMNGHEPRTIGNANLKTILLALYDYFMVVVAFALALWIRFDCRYSAIPADEVGAFIWFVPIYAALCVLVFSLFRLYRSVWKFASFMELMHMAFATLILAVVHVVGTIVIFHRMPVAYYILGVTFQFAFTMGIRFIYRFVRLLDHRYERKVGGTLSPVMLIGGGQAGQMILRDIKQAKEISEKVVCIIDDDPAKVGRYIDGIRVVGNRDHILKAAQDFKIQKIYVAIPSASAAERRDILDICKETGAQIKLLPGMYQLVSGEISVQNMRDVRIEDLLGREPIRIATDAILSQLKGKVVLVTGGGGSIGSELCRQIACHEPRQLIILDIYENATYDIQLELKKKHPELDLVTLIGSVRDSRKMFQVFEHYKPDIVYHAAAHKHVPLMEDSPCEAIKNNAFGTYKTAFAAMANGCKRFVLISTDKAVNPTNIMGASKRLCEMVIQSFDRMVKDGRAADVPQLFTHIVKDL